METKDKMRALAGLLCEEVSMALREAEGNRYFLTGERYVGWESFGKDHELASQFACHVGMVPDMDQFLSSREARDSLVFPARDSLSETIGPKGTFVVARMPDLVPSAHCPEDQVQAANCDIQGGYPHVRCVLSRHRFDQKQCHATLDLAYYRVS